MLMTILRSLINPSRGIAVPAVASIMITFCAVGGAAADRPDSFADQVEQLSPAVVNISTTTIVSEGPGMDMPQFPPGSPFEEFFKNFGDDNRQRRASSLGSGFIIDAEGIVVTNFHVIENAEEITVTLSDETSFTAKVLGQDQKTDIAVLKIDPGDTTLTAVPFGDSDSLRVGDWVLAIGNPFGLGGTVTAGIVSARGRDIGNGPYDDFIQTDASINRGNSGGPLFNTDGEVIGITVRWLGRYWFCYFVKSCQAGDQTACRIRHNAPRLAWCLYSGSHIRYCRDAWS
jgi:serine protease Do